MIRPHPFHHPHALDRARAVRRHSIDADAAMWRALRDVLPRARFMRGIQIGPYVADFVSRPAKLIVEVDYGGHRGAREASRTRFLNRHGYRLIRFWHRDVAEDVHAVVDAIACALPPELLADSGATCRLNGAAARAEWSPMPDLPARPTPGVRSMEPAR